jgi:hypothetical protein
VNDRRYRTPINGPVLLMALGCWLIIVLVVLILA